MEHLDLDALRVDLQTLVTPESGERFEVRREMPDGGITGFLVRKNWRGNSMAFRQNELNQHLRKQFGDLASDVTLILTFTPEEYEAWAEDHIAA